jgi:hypothetical protein
LLDGRITIAQIQAGVGVEEAFDSFVGALQYNLVGLAGRLSLAYVIDFVGRVGALRTLRQFFDAQARAGRGDHYSSTRKAPSELWLENERASGDADGHDVQANAEANPQMDLKQGAANP